MLRARPSLTPMHRGRLPTCSCRHARVDGPERPSGRNAYSCGITPSTIMSPTRSHPGPWTEIRPGARAHAPSDSASTAPVKRFALGPPGRPRGDRAPPPALNQQSRVAHATQQHQPGSRACPVVPAQIRSSAERGPYLDRKTGAMKPTLAVAFTQSVSEQSPRQPDERARVLSCLGGRRIRPTVASPSSTAGDCAGQLPAIHASDARQPRL